VSAPQTLGGEPESCRAAARRIHDLADVADHTAERLLRKHRFSTQVFGGVAAGAFDAELDRVSFRCRVLADRLASVARELRHLADRLDDAAALRHAATLTPGPERSRLEGLALGIEELAHERWRHALHEAGEPLGRDRPPLPPELRGPGPLPLPR
jgi:uncharacterized protein YukE